MLISSIETWFVSDLRPHPENALIFGDPRESKEWPAILADIKKRGIQVPLVIKQDGTVLAGHLRLACAEELGIKSVPASVADPFPSYRDELEWIIKDNTSRRQLMPGEIALAFKRLRTTPKEEGGTKGKKGGGAKGKRGAPNHSSASGQMVSPRADEEAAEALGVGKHEARALETVFTTDGVPDELKKAVNSGVVKPTPAAKAVKTELKRQGGAITDDSALKAVAKPAPKAKPQTADVTHLDRVREESAKYERDYRELFEVYKRLDGLLSRRPLRSLIGASEHHQYGDLIRDVALRAWREIESVKGPTEAGKQMSLTTIKGGKA